MDGSKKKMLLFGHGYGRNVEGKLKVLNNVNFFDVTFIAYKLDNSFRDKYPFIHYVPIRHLINIKHPLNSVKCFIFIYKMIRCSGHIDVVYSLGVGGAVTALLFFLATEKTKKAIEIWSIHILEKAKRNHNISERFDRFVIDHADFICQYWWGIREAFMQLFPQYENKFLMYQLSYPDIYFEGNNHSPKSEFVKSFLAKIPDSQIVCFWPRSFIPSNNHVCLLEAIGIINKRQPDLLSNFKLYLWGGNAQSDISRQLIEDSIVKLDLEKYVEIVDHPYVPQNDIFAIEERSDFFVQIANDDILSTYIMEMICSGKPFILSNLRTFQFLNEKYHLGIEFVNNDPVDISARIIRILTGISKEEEIENKKRREICRCYFSSSLVSPFAQVLYNRL